MKDRWGAAHFLVFDGSGHLPFFEVPNQFFPAFLDFLRAAPNQA
jgi:pimeloyl-ACP methyl ester carboxylesterase